MANTTTSPNMNMPVPTVGEDPGPDWATNYDACLSVIDGHTHTSGSGVPITPTAININADLPMNNNNLTTAKSVRFTTQSAPLSGNADLGCLYESGVDLYYNDGSGNQVRITQSGAVTGATGTITGLPSGTASASYSAGTFSFQSATNTPGSISGGSIVVGQQVASGKGVTIAASGSQPANYNLTLPTALPAATSFVTSDASGNLSFSENVGLLVSSTVPSASGVSLTSGVPANITSISLPAGSWSVTAIIGVNIVGGSANNFTGTIGLVSAALGTQGDNSFSSPVPTPLCDSSLCIANYPVTVASTTTYYMVASVTYSGGSSQGYGRFIARKI